MKLLVVLGFVVTLICSINANTLLVNVYYENKCPHSKDFIVQQLVPTVKQLHNYVKVKLIPFGKAKSVGDSNGPDSFKCRHGPSECLGNMVQDCTINYMVGRTDVAIVNYVSCEMITQAGTTRNFQCVQKAHVPVDGIQQCLNSEEGFNLQLKSENLTKIINPTFVPTITVNGVFDVHTQSQAQQDLMGALCNYIPNVPECSSDSTAT